jgi:hypothetical protein
MYEVVLVELVTDRFEQLPVVLRIVVRKHWLAVIEYSNI